MKCRGVVLRENPSKKDEPECVATNSLDGPSIIDRPKSGISQFEIQFFTHFSDTGGKWRLISFDAAARDLPRVLIYGVYE